MKRKKLFLLFSMFAVLFSLTACSDGQGHVDFAYTEPDIISASVSLAYNLQNVDDASRAYLNAEGDEVFKTGLSNFDTAKEECGSFQGYVSAADGSTIMIDFTEVDETQFLLFLSQVDAEVEEDGENVIVTLNAVYEKRNVALRFVYEEDTAYAYGGSSSPYQVKEITVAPEYTFGEKMGKAGANTLMGMGTVFVVLIFISIIIAQFERIAKGVTALSNKNEDADSKEEVKKTNKKSSGTAAKASSSEANPMDDTQLVAVITAAVMAASTASGGSDKLIVRSIRKAKR